MPAPEPARKRPKRPRKAVVLEFIAHHASWLAGTKQPPGISVLTQRVDYSNEWLGFVGRVIAIIAFMVWWFWQK